MRDLLRVTTLLALCLMAAPGIAQSITISPEVAVVGQESMLRFDAPVDTLMVTYRPNSVVSQQDTLRVGGFDSVRWTPKRAGVVRIATSGGASQNVSVRFTEAPMSGLVILIGAGLILFGGAIFAMRKLLSGDAPRVMPEDLPDT